MKELMYYRSDPTQEQMVWLVWELQGGRPALAVICTTDGDLARYITDDRKFFHGTTKAVFCEKVMCDHRYGAHDSSIAMRLMRATT